METKTYFLKSVTPPKHTLSAEGKYRSRPQTPPRVFPSRALWRSTPIQLASVQDPVMSVEPPSKPMEIENFRKFDNPHELTPKLPNIKSKTFSGFSKHRRQSSAYTVCENPDSCNRVHENHHVVVQECCSETSDNSLTNPRNCLRTVHSNKLAISPQQSQPISYHDQRALMCSGSHRLLPSHCLVKEFSCKQDYGSNNKYCLMTCCSDSSTSSVGETSAVASKRRTRSSRSRHQSNITSRLSVPDRTALYFACSDANCNYNNRLTCFPTTSKISQQHSDDPSNLQKLSHLESDKKNLLLQVSVLNDQVEAQTEKIREMESLLIAKKNQLMQAEQNLHQEMMTRSAVENGKLELMTEISSLRLRLTASERDRKDSDERCRRIESELNCLQSCTGSSDVERSPFRSKVFQNGPILSPQRNYEIEKLRHALDTVMSKNDEKDRKIEELSHALIKCRKLKDSIIGNHCKATSEIGVPSNYYEGDYFKDMNLRSNPKNENVKIYSLSAGKIHPQQQQIRSNFRPPDEVDWPGKESSTLNYSPNSNSKCSNFPTIHKSNSMEDIHQTSCKVAPSRSPYSTMPRQSGPQALHNLHEQLQYLECSPLQTNSHRPPIFSTSIENRKQHSVEDRIRAPPHNKSTGVSFGKGFFKLRSGKRSSSAPELAPFESVTIPIEREVSSATPTPQPTMHPFLIKAEKERTKGLFKFLTKWKRSGSQNIEKLEADFRRGGIRATAGPRLGWTQDSSIDFDIPFTRWNNDVIVEWLHKIGLNVYVSDCKKWRCNGEKLLNASPSELEKELNIKNPLHKKKLMLALKSVKSDELPSSVKTMDYQWVVRWLDDIGIPQYKDNFADARVDGRVLHFLTVEDLLSLKVTNQLHHISIKRGIQVLRQKNFDPHCLIRRSVPDDKKVHMPSSVALWTNHRVMEWLRTVDLSEYAPNLRGSGVHGALIIYEPKFNADLFATLLNIPPTKTLLRRHLATHFKTIVGPEFIQLKRNVEEDQQYTPLTPSMKIKAIRKPHFTTKKKSKADTNAEEYICPMDISIGCHSVKQNKEKLIVRRNSDPTLQESRQFHIEDEKTVDKIGAVSKEITTLTDMLSEEELLENVPTTNV